MYPGTRTVVYMLLSYLLPATLIIQRQYSTRENVFEQKKEYDDTQQYILYDDTTVSHISTGQKCEVCVWNYNNSF